VPEKRWAGPAVGAENGAGSGQLVEQGREGGRRLAERHDRGTMRTAKARGGTCKAAGTDAEDAAQPHGGANAGGRWTRRHDPKRRAVETPNECTVGSKSEGEACHRGFLRSSRRRRMRSAHRFTTRPTTPPAVFKYERRPQARRGLLAQTAARGESGVRALAVDPFDANYVLGRPMNAVYRQLRNAGSGALEQKLKRRASGLPVGCSGFTPDSGSPKAASTVLLNQAIGLEAPAFALRTDRGWSWETARKRPPAFTPNHGSDWSTAGGARRHLFLGQLPGMAVLESHDGGVSFSAHRRPPGKQITRSFTRPRSVGTRFTALG